MSPQVLPPGSRAGGSVIAAVWRRSRLKWWVIGGVVLLAATAVVVVVTSGQGKQGAKGDADPKLLRAPVQPMPAPASQVPQSTASSVMELNELYLQVSIV